MTTRWLVPLDDSTPPRDPDLEYEMTPLERQQEATDWVTWVMAYKQYPPFTAYQKGRDFRPQATKENK